MGVTLVHNLWCLPFIAMIPVIAKAEFGLTPTQVGILSSCEGFGGLIGAVVLGFLARERTLARFYFSGPFCFLSLLVVLSFTLSVGSAVGIIFLVGLAASCFSVTQYALVYLFAPPELRGRATGFLCFCIGFAMLGRNDT